MKRRSLFSMALILLCVFGGILGILIYTSLKLQSFNIIQLETSDLPYRWSQFESATKQLLITYNTKDAEKRWVMTFKSFKSRFDRFIGSDFSRRLLARDIDFQIAVARAEMHWTVIQRKLLKTKLKLTYYNANNQLFVQNRDTGNLLVNFGENHATHSYYEPLIALIAQLRSSLSLSDHLFAAELVELNTHVKAVIRSQTRKVLVMSVLLSALILGIAVLFLLYHMRAMALSREESRRYVQGLSAEIEERKLSEGLLRSEERKMRVVMDALGEGMYIVNRDFMIEYQNAYLEKTYNQPANILCYEAYSDFKRPCPYCRVREIIASGERHQIEVSPYDGRHYELIFSPFDDIDGETKAIVLCYDITYKKEMEAETQRVAHLASVGELAAGVAHEINNPINGIISVAEIVKDLIQDNGEDTTLADRIIHEGDRIARIVKNLLHFSRPRAKNHRPCAIADIMADALGLVEKQLAKDGIHLRIDNLSSVPRISAQNQEIQQVFLNLISNARYALNQKFRKPNVQKSLEIKGETFGTEEHPGVRVIFYDRGTGIPDDIRDQICNPFFSTKPKGQGTGLGLSVSHAIMKNHDGRLAFKSRVGHYAQVSVEFPLPKKVPEKNDGNR